MWVHLRWTIGPHYPISNSCKRWTIRKQPKIHIDEDLLVRGDSSVDLPTGPSLSPPLDPVLRRGKRCGESRQMLTGGHLSGLLMKRAAGARLSIQAIVGRYSDSGMACHMQGFRDRRRTRRRNKDRGR